MPKVLLIAAFAGLFSQTLKIAVQLSHGEPFSWRLVDSYGGMPSSHTAIVVGLTTALGFSEGWGSPVVAIATVFSLIVIRDAIGFRRYLGVHSQALNRIVADLPDAEQKPFRHFRERIGHTPLEAFVGAVLGFAVAAIFTLVLS